jgi:hypothetical protein
MIMGWCLHQNMMTKLDTFFGKKCALIVDNTLITVATAVITAVVFKHYKKHSRQVLSFNQCYKCKHTTNYTYKKKQSSV